MSSSIIQDPDLILDNPITEQNWACVSFLSPEDMIKKRFLFEAHKFLYHDVNTKISDLSAVMTDMINRKFREKVTEHIENIKNEMETDSDSVNQTVIINELKSIMNDVALNEDSMRSTALRNYRIKFDELMADFESYKQLHYDDLEKEFDSENNKTQSVRSFKVRGAFEHYEDAAKRAHFCRNIVEKNFDVFVAPIGKWCPWDPNPTGKIEEKFMLEEQQDLYDKYKKNMEDKEIEFTKRKQAMIDKSDEDKKDNLKKEMMVED